MPLLSLSATFVAACPPPRDGRAGRGPPGCQPLARARAPHRHPGRRRRGDGVDRPRRRARPAGSSRAPGACGRPGGPRARTTARPGPTSCPSRDRSATSSTSASPAPRRTTCGARSGPGGRPRAPARCARACSPSSATTSRSHPGCSWATSGRAPPSTRRCASCPASTTPAADAWVLLDIAFDLLGDLAHGTVWLWSVRRLASPGRRRPAPRPSPWRSGPRRCASAAPDRPARPRAAAALRQRPPTRTPPSRRAPPPPASRTT